MKKNETLGSLLNEFKENASTNFSKSQVTLGVEIENTSKQQRSRHTVTITGEEVGDGLKRTGSGLAKVASVVGSGASRVTSNVGIGLKRVASGLTNRIKSAKEVNITERASDATSVIADGAQAMKRTMSDGATSMRRAMSRAGLEEVRFKFDFEGARVVSSS